MPAIVRSYEWVHMTTALRRTGERRNKRVWWPLLPTEIRAKRAPFRLIAPLDEKHTTYLAKKLTFATPRPPLEAKGAQLGVDGGDLAGAYPHGRRPSEGLGGSVHQGHAPHAEPPHHAGHPPPGF